MNLAIEQTWDGRPARRDEVVQVRAVAVPDGLEVVVDAPRHHDPPPARPAGCCPGLWAHEVVELFVLGEGDRYLELEVGPHGHHLALTLAMRRRPIYTHPDLPVRWTAAPAGRWSAVVQVPRALLPPRPRSVNAYAIHGLGASRRYLAWRPTKGPQPDFHRLEAFGRAPELFAPLSLRAPSRG